MAERFEKLFLLSPNLYSKDSPVIVSAGSLLKDTETGSVIVQLKFKNIDRMAIKALKISISAYDVSGAEVEGIEDYQYLDLSVSSGQDFGSNKAIMLPNAVTRSFSIKSVVVVLSDGSCHNLTIPLEPLKTSEKLQAYLKDYKLVEQYQLMTSKNAIYVPIDSDGIWCCTCGEWNKDSICSKCKEKKADVFGFLDTSVLSGKIEERIVLEKAEREEQERKAELARQEEEIRKEQKIKERDELNKKIKKAIPFVCALIVIIIAAKFFVDLTEKNEIYEEAVALQENEQYEEALFRFSEISEHKDSSEHMEYIINELMFTNDDMSIRKAVRLLEAYPTGNEKLLKTCQAIYRVEDNKYYHDNYTFSADYWLDNGIPYANVEYDNYLGEFQEGAEVVESSYSDYLIEIKAIGIFKGEKNLMTFAINEEYAYSDLSSGYTLEFLEKMNKEEYVSRAEKEAQNEQVYQKANDKLNSKDYSQAISLFEQIIDYKDSKDKIAEAEQALLSLDYTEAEKMLEDGQNYEAALAFYELGDFEDSWERSFEIWGKITKRDTVSVEEYNSVAVKINGEVVATGAGWDDELDVEEWSDIQNISIGGRHTIGLKSNGTVVAVGYESKINENNSCLSVDWWDGIVAISAGGEHSVGLKADGTVVAVGDNLYNQCEVNGWTDIVAISAGTYHTVGLKKDGTVVSTQINSFSDEYWGQCDVGTWEDIVAISAGENHTVGLKSNGTVVAVGFSMSYSEIKEWEDIVSISASGQHTIGLKSDGTVLRAGRTIYGADESEVSKVSKWKNIVEIFASPTHILGLKGDGSVVAVGNNEEGQCDTSSWTSIKR